MTTIKITQLTDIGANLATSTVLPVVNMAGTPTTQKTTVGNIANLALSQAGNSYPAAAQAVLAQTVTNTAQPNITSVGTLTGLTVSGNASINGNIISNGTAYLGNISTTGSASITTLSVGATSNLGAVGNITITGGSNGQVLTTAGNGSLSWTTATLSGDGGNISNIAGANVTGTVGNANLAQFIDVSDVNNNFSYHVVLSAGSGDKSVHIDADDNLQYNPADGTLTAVRVDATYVIADLQFANGYPLANVTGVGNIAVTNYDGNSSNVLRGDGTWAPDASGTYGDSNVVTLLGAFGSNTISTTGLITGDGGGLSNVPYANVTGTPTLGNISSVNLDGNASNLLTGSGTYVAIPVVPAVGNIATLNLDGNVSNLLTGNGTYVAIPVVPAVGNIATLNLDGNVSNVLAGDGTFVALPVIDANTIVWTTAPVANTSTGTSGQAAYDSGGNLYVCVATDTWAKFAGSTSW